MSSESNDPPRDASNPTANDRIDHDRPGPAPGIDHAADTRQRILAATRQAEVELLEAKCAELEATTAELEAEVEELESELERKRRALQEVVTHYERLLAKRSE